MIPDPGAGDSHLAALRKRIHDLETMLQSPGTPGASPAGPALRGAPKSSPARGVLFGGSQPIPMDTPANDVIARLRAAAGAAPMRLAAHERTLREGRPTTNLNSLQTEVGLEAVEDAEIENGLKELEATVADPMQKMMLRQMQQMAMMAKQQNARSQDPISAALGGSTDSQSTGSSGVKGCLAREAFLKLMQDLPKYAQVVTANAAAELGLEVHQIGPRLMRDYIEKRSPLGENRALVQNAYLWAWAWEMGYKLNNAELMGVACRGLVYTGQTAIDYGRTSLSRNRNTMGFKGTGSGQA